jgi:hypothetical protein
MTGQEIQNFYNADKQEYLLINNEEFLSIFKDYQKFNRDFGLEAMTKLMDDIVNFYEFKFPNELYDGSITEKSQDYQSIIEVANLLNLNQLRLRLHHDAREFLRCDYWEHVTLTTNDNIPYPSRMHYIRISNGLVNPYDLSKLPEISSTQDRAKTPEELLVTLSTKTNNVDYSHLEQLVEHHDINVVLRKKLLELTALKMLYSKNTLPIYSCKRVKHFIKEFNENYGLDLNDSQIESIMFRDYGLNRILSPNHETN